MASKTNSLNDFLAKKETECDDLVRENEKNRKSLKQCQFELEQIRDSSDSSNIVLRKDISELKIENEDLVELIKTKERMLEDQLSQINQLKMSMGDKEEDMREMGDAKNKYRDFYEDKLGIEIEATERAKAKLEDADQRLQELVDECENQR